MPIIQKRFNKGMNSDALDFLQPAEQYQIALNAVSSTRDSTNFGLANEESNELVWDSGATIKGKAHVSEWNKTILFVYDGTSAIYIFDHKTNTAEFVCRDSEFGCDWGFDNCEYMYAEFKHFNSCRELHAYFSSKDIYYVININEMLDDIRKQNVIDCEDCSHFELFHSVCSPNMAVSVAEFSGAMLEGGAYSFAVQLEDEDLNTTNWFGISQTVHVPTPDNIAGQVAKNAVRLTLDSLDIRYKKVNIAVIKTVAGVTTVEKVAGVSYSNAGITYDYYGQKGEQLNIATVVTPKEHYLRGNDLLMDDGRLLIYNIKNEPNLNYQKYANDVALELVEHEVTMEQQLKYNYPSLLRGEVYAFGIRWNYNDGTHSRAFHIPGSDCGGSGGNTQGLASASAAQDAGYVEFGADNFISDNQHQRLRNPSEYEDRPNEFDVLEEDILANISEFSTSESDMPEAGSCHDNLYSNCPDPIVCCDPENPENPTIISSDCDECDEASEALSEDIENFATPYHDQMDIISFLGLDDPNPQIPSESLKSASERMVQDAVINREYEKTRKPEFLLQDKQPGSSGENSTRNRVEGMKEPVSKNVRLQDSNIITVKLPTGAKSLRSDNWTDGYGNNLTEEAPRKIGTHCFDVFSSSLDYPDAKDCFGDRFYPEGSIKYHKVPSCSQIPHYVSYQNGVVNEYQPENYEYGNTYVRLLGIRATNIQFPPEKDLPKPLCPNNPYSIVYVPRTRHNKRVLAKGWMSGIFEGDVRGKRYAYPRHGVNSFEHVDRFVSSGVDGTSRMGEQSDRSAYTFHSPDTDCDRAFLPATHIQQELNLVGSGWRHGLYARGRRPQVDAWSGSRTDQRGARVSNNINHYTGAGGNLVEVTGITYVDANTVVTPPAGIDLPLMNRYRESSVYLQTSDNVSGDGRDESFVGDVLDHFAPTKASAPYVGIIRDIPDQYGSVESLQYTTLGIEAHAAHAAGIGTIEGICGDVFIGPYSKRRTSYVSNKVGNYFDVPAKPGSPQRPRSVCDLADDKVFEYLGINYYSTRLPESGDLYDAKNYAGLHTIGDATSLSASQAAATGVSQSEYYYPRVLKSLVHCVVESSVNPHLRETGEGPQIVEGKVWYPKLKDLYLDSRAPDGHPWEESFLNRFYCAVEQPSRKQLAKKAMVRTLIAAILPALGLSQVTNMEAIVDSVGTMLIAPVVFALWLMANQVWFTNKKLDALFGIPSCKRDEEGGENDNCIQNFEDAYNRYNYDYSKITNEKPIYAPPLNYNVCNCGGTNNKIYHSDKQILDSEVDAARNIRINAYNEIPAQAGKLQKLFKLNGRLYAHTSDGIWLLRVAEGSIPSDIGTQITGAGSLIADPVMLFEGGDGGIMGTEYPNSSINVSGWGYFFVDNIAKKVYRFNGSEPEELSRYGKFSFFKENLYFCKELCLDENQEGETHFSIGWDPRYDRLLLTKHDADEGDSWTLSYYPMLKSWISYHSYIPQDYLWDRDNFYSFKDGQIWKHHVSDTYQNFYGEQFPFLVQGTLVSETIKCFRAQSMDVFTFAEKAEGGGFIRDLDIFFDEAALWTANTGTGTRPTLLIGNDDGSIDSQKSRIEHNPGVMTWYRTCSGFASNDFQDLTDVGCSNMPIELQDGCQIIPTINENRFSCDTVNKADFKNRELRDKYLKFRFILNRTDVRMHLMYLSLTTKEKPTDI